MYSFCLEKTWLDRQYSTDDKDEPKCSKASSRRCNKMRNIKCQAHYNFNKNAPTSNSFWRIEMLMYLSWSLSMSISQRTLWRTERASDMERNSFWRSALRLLRVECDSESESDSDDTSDSSCSELESDTSFDRSSGSLGECSGARVLKLRSFTAETILRSVFAAFFSFLEFIACTQSPSLNS